MNRSIQRTILIKSVDGRGRVIDRTFTGVYNLLAVGCDRSLHRSWRARCELTIVYCSIGSGIFFYPETANETGWSCSWVQPRTFRGFVRLTRKYKVDKSSDSLPYLAQWVNLRNATMIISDIPLLWSFRVLTAFGDIAYMTRWSRLSEDGCGLYVKSRSSDESMRNSRDPLQPSG
jgi:hypothetical protein